MAIQMSASTTVGMTGRDAGHCGQGRPPLQLLNYCILSNIFTLDKIFNTYLVL